MNINEPMTLTGEVLIKHFDKNGNLKSENLIKNLVVTAGKEWAATRFDKDADQADAMSHMALGSNGTAQALTDTALGAELGRVALADAVPAGNQIAYSATFPAATATGAVVEAGIFNAAAAGTMLCRTTFAVKNKEAADTITATWTITVN